MLTAVLLCQIDCDVHFETSFFNYFQEIFLLLRKLLRFDIAKTCFPIF